MSCILSIEFPIDTHTQFTVRVNTFRRNDLLEKFLAHYTTCDEIKEIQVIWSDQENTIPSTLQKQYSSDKVKYEQHDTDKLSNRFRSLLNIPTEGVLSIDDDLLISCRELSQAHSVWTANKRALVGFSPRMNAYDPNTGADRYLRWQHTWWNGVYSIILTKACFLHKNFLEQFFKVLPEERIRKIDANRNCEDIAMAYVVARETNAPPVWVRGVVNEEASEGISTGVSHFIDRSDCLRDLREIDSKRVWIPSYQKAESISSVFDLFKLFSGRYM